jgi:hypothetical protein
MRNSDHPKYQLFGALWGIFWSLVLSGILIAVVVFTDIL